MEQQVARHSEEKRELLSTVKEDAVTKSSVQQIIYDIERESQAQIGRLLEENGMEVLRHWMPLQPTYCLGTRCWLPSTSFWRTGRIKYLLTAELFPFTSRRSQGSADRSVASRTRRGTAPARRRRRVATVLPSARGGVRTLEMPQLHFH